MRAKPFENTRPHPCNFKTAALAKSGADAGAVERLKSSLFQQPASNFLTLAFEFDI
jgi:hypothetical protein